MTLATGESVGVGRTKACLIGKVRDVEEVSAEQPAGVVIGHTSETLVGACGPSRVLVVEERIVEIIVDVCGPAMR